MRRVASSPSSTSLDGTCDETTPKKAAWSPNLYAVASATGEHDGVVEVRPSEIGDVLPSATPQAIADAQAKLFAVCAFSVLRPSEFGRSRRIIKPRLQKTSGGLGNLLISPVAWM